MTTETPDPQPASERTPLSPEALARPWMRAALIWLLLGMLAGLTYAIQFVIDWGRAAIPATPVHAAGRLRMFHSTAMIYGFVLSGLMAGAVGWTLRPLERRSPLVPWLRVGFWIFQAMLFFGAAGILYGRAEGLMWGELPRSFMFGLIAVWALLFGVWLAGADRSKGSNAAGLWLVGVGFAGGLATLGLGLYLQATESRELHLSPMSGLFKALWINAFAIPLTLGFVAFRLGGIAKEQKTNPLVSFCIFALALTAPFADAEAWSAMPLREWPYAVCATAGAAYQVCMVILIGCLWRRAKMRGANDADCLRARTKVWLAGAGISLAAAALMRFGLTLRPLQQAFQFTDVYIALHHLVFFGAAGFAIFAAFDDLWPRGMARKENRAAWRGSIVGWLALVFMAGGLAFMVPALLGAGLGQSLAWRQPGPWMESIRASQPWWVLRLIAGSMMLLGLSLLLVDAMRFARSRLRRESEATAGGAEADPAVSGMIYPLASLLWFGLSLALVWPALLRPTVAEIASDFDYAYPEDGIVAEFYDLVERNYPTAFERHFGRPDREAYEQAVQLGERVYRAEGCFHCHTQYVRPHTPDAGRWGRPGPAGSPGAPWFRPQLAGGRRVGPDLAREAGRRSNDWHAAHLYRPYAVVPGSIMPATPWLFEEREGELSPTREGLALIVYLQSLGTHAVGAEATTTVGSGGSRKP